MGHPKKNDDEVVSNDDEPETFVATWMVRKRMPSFESTWMWKGQPIFGRTTPDELGSAMLDPHEAALRGPSSGGWSSCKDSGLQLGVI